MYFDKQYIDVDYTFTTHMSSISCWIFTSKFSSFDFGRIAKYKINACYLTRVKTFIKIIVTIILYPLSFNNPYRFIILPCKQSTLIILISDSLQHPTMVLECYLRFKKDLFLEI
jgi:hypothetical protein